MRTQKKTSWIWLGVMAALLGWTAYTICKDQTPGQLAQAIAKADPRFLLAAVGVMALFIALEAKATHWILRALGSPQRMRHCYFFSCVGFFFSNITPSATGGQPAQVYYMKRRGVPVATGTMDMLLVTIGYQTATVGFALAALYTHWDLLAGLGGQVGLLLGVGLTVFIALDVGMIALLLLPNPARRLCRGGIALACRVYPALNRKRLEEGMEGQLERYAQGAEILRRRPVLLVQVLGASAGQLFCSYLIPYLVYRSFGLSGMTLGEMVALQAMCAVAVGYLPLPGGAGAAEGVFLRSFLVPFGPGLVAPAMLLSRGL